jgi:hypothetical protein
MRRIRNIFLVLCAIFISVGVADVYASAHTSQHEEYQGDKSEQHSVVFPEKQPQLFAIHRQGQSAINHLRNTPAPNAKNNNQEVTNPGLLTEKPIRRAVTLSLVYSRHIDQSLTIRELLFPFHHFL